MVSDPTKNAPRRSAFELFLNGELKAQDPGQTGPAPKAGGTCPQCAQGRLDYDALLNLGCPDCGYTLAGCFT